VYNGDRTSKKTKFGENDILPEAGIANTDSAQVDRVLSRVIQKHDFAEMDILGQYNLAFIIARRRKLEKAEQLIDDLFIIGVSGISVAVEDLAIVCGWSSGESRSYTFRPMHVDLPGSLASTRLMQCDRNARHTDDDDHPHTIARSSTVSQEWEEAMHQLMSNN
jgi:hypothetical protein